MYHMYVTIYYIVRNYILYTYVFFWVCRFCHKNMDRRIPSKRLLRSEDSGSKRLRRGLESGAGNSSKDLSKQKRIETVKKC